MEEEKEKDEIWAAMDEVNKKGQGHTKLSRDFDCVYEA
jgi:hypothetical protein